MDNIGEKLQKELKNGILVAYRLKNHQVLYSIMNRPEPTLSGVDDHTLATALVFAGNKFELIFDPKFMSAPEKVSRSDGRDVSYNESMEIDWEKGTITSTRRTGTTLQVLQAVVGQLMKTASSPSAAIPKGPPSPAKAN